MKTRQSSLCVPCVSSCQAERPREAHNASSIGACPPSHLLHLHLRVIAQHAQAPARTRNVAADARAPRVDELRTLLRKRLCFHTLWVRRTPPPQRPCGWPWEGCGARYVSTRLSVTARTPEPVLQREARGRRKQHLNHCHRLTAAHRAPLAKTTPTSIALLLATREAPCYPRVYVSLDELANTVTVCEHRRQCCRRTYVSVSQLASAAPWLCARSGDVRR